MTSKTQQMSKEYEILNKKYESINYTYTNESDVYSKKVALLTQQIKKHEVTFNNLTSEVEILKETNRKLQERYVVCVKYIQFVFDL